MPRCDQCRYFHPYPPADKPDQMIMSDDGIRGGGECRLKPPTIVSDQRVASFPIVESGAWCGCFEAKDKT